jgi:hypothetical protein
MKEYEKRKITAGEIQNEIHIRWLLTIHILVIANWLGLRWPSG